MAALMHMILKEHNKMWPLKEISKELSLEYRAVMKQTWLLNKTLDTEKESLKSQRKTAIDYLHEYEGKISENKELMTKTEETLNKIKRSGGNPIGQAADAFHVI